MKKVFASGSCRVVEVINDGRQKVIPIHSLTGKLRGVNFLGKLHNTKQHIQLIKFIKGEITMKPRNLALFLTSYARFFGNCKPTFKINTDPLSMNENKLKNIRENFDDCDVYIFEICSLKLYTNEDYHVQYEITDNSIKSIQTKEELVNDLHKIVSLIPEGKRIIFQSHFRYNIIKNNEKYKIEKREIIHSVLEEFCNNYENVFHYDPSYLLKNNNELYDGDLHFTSERMNDVFDHLYKNYII